jgi:hypothetical protein
VAQTYRITIEYTTTQPASPYGTPFQKASDPNYWDWPELLDLDLTRETFGVWVEKVETNADHVRDIILYANAEDDA